jgi:hypothetical protein
MAGRPGTSRLDGDQSAPTLVVLTGGQPREFLLSLPRLTIGREPSCDVVLKSKYASKRHARLELRDGAYFIADLGSTNHVYVNDDLILGPCRLRDGDLIRIADIELKYHARSRARGTGETEVFEAVPALPLSPRESAQQEIAIDAGRRKVWVRGVEVKPALSRQEFELLKLLGDAAGRVCSRDQLCETIWGPNAYEYSLLYRLAHRLKGKLATLAGRELVESIPGVGYRLDI